MDFENGLKNVINLDQDKLNSAYKDRLEKTGKMGDIMADVGEQISVHDERKAEGRETRGKWSIWVVDQEDQGENPVRFIIGRDDRGEFILLPNDAEHMRQEYIFSTDREAESARTILSQKFPEIKADNFRVLCGGIDEVQEAEPQFRVIPGRKKD